MTVFVDLFRLPEDERIIMMAKLASEGRIIGFIVEDDEKADRYLKKMEATGLKFKLMERMIGPTPGTIFIKVGPVPQ